MLLGKISKILDSKPGGLSNFHHGYQILNGRVGFAIV